MKKVLVVLGVLVWPLAVQAHEIKTAGSVEVLLHMEPQDSPVVGEPAVLYLSFDDREEKFGLADCDCLVVIRKGGQELHSTDLITQEDYGFNVGSIIYSFPSKGIYTVDLIAASKSGKFDPINLSYDVRIERESLSESPVDPLSRPSSFDQTYWIIIAVVIVCVIILLTVRVLKRKK